MIQTKKTNWSDIKTLEDLKSILNQIPYETKLSNVGGIQYNETDKSLLIFERKR